MLRTPGTYVLVLLEVCVCMFYEGVCLCYT